MPEKDNRDSTAGDSGFSRFLSMNGKKILFLGYGCEETKIIEATANNGYEVSHTTEKLTGNFDFDLIVSFGYRHILRPAQLAKISCPIINLHMSLLPWNRGAHPNFWSFFDETPAGVTIHLVDEGLDTGPILLQQLVQFRPDENTFDTTYQRLISELETLFLKNLNAIINQNIEPIDVAGVGSFHRRSDLPAEFLGWASNVTDEVKRLKSATQEPLV